jgi:hypothetical protein
MGNTRINENVRRVLGLAAQILEDLPEEHRRPDAIEGMRAMLAGRFTGRNEPIIHQAIAMVLVWRTQEIIANPPNYEREGPDYPIVEEKLLKTVGARVSIGRIKELQALFELIHQADAGSLAGYFVAACDWMPGHPNWPSEHPSRDSAT